MRQGAPGRDTTRPNKNRHEAGFRYQSTHVTRLGASVAEATYCIARMRADRRDLCREALFLCTMRLLTSESTTDTASL